MMTFKLIVAILFFVVFLYSFVIKKEWLFLKGYDGLSDYAHYAHKRVNNFEKCFQKNSEKVNKIQGIIAFIIRISWIALITITLLL